MGLPFTSSAEGLTAIFLLLLLLLPSFISAPILEAGRGLVFVAGRLAGRFLSIFSIFFLVNFRVNFVRRGPRRVKVGLPGTLFFFFFFFFALLCTTFLACANKAAAAPASHYSSAGQLKTKKKYSSFFSYLLFDCPANWPFPPSYSFLWSGLSLLIAFKRGNFFFTNYKVKLYRLQGEI